MADHQSSGSWIGTKRRWLSVWLRRFPIYRLEIAEQIEKGGLPFALFIEHGQKLVVTAADGVAEGQGVTIGSSLADARALAPGLIAVKHRPKDDAEALKTLAGWAQRYSPITGTDGEDGLWLDITGCAHLFGGEEKMLTLIRRQLHQNGYPSRGSIADSRAAAWAIARYLPTSQTVVPVGLGEDFLSPLPVEALGIDPDTVASLSRVGLRRITDLNSMPRASLARRFPDTVLRRLDSALGRQDEARAPHKITPRIRSWEKFAEPISVTSDVEACIRLLLEKLCATLILRNQGARHLRLNFYRVDGSDQELTVGTSEPVRDPQHLYRLFALKTETVEPGFGIELAILEALESEAIRAIQTEVLDVRAESTSRTLPALLDRLANRFGPASVLRMAAQASHIPERAEGFVSVFAPRAATSWPRGLVRPSNILRRPQHIDASERDDREPTAFVWQRVAHRVVKVQGPERIDPEWWQQSGHPRDYYRVEDDQGRRLWIYRQETAKGARWFVHGLFA